MQNPRLSANTISIVFPFAIHVIGAANRRRITSAQRLKKISSELRTLRARPYLVKILRFAVITGAASVAGRAGAGR
jgi:hypothetical protein